MAKTQTKQRPSALRSNGLTFVKPAPVIEVEESDPMQEFQVVIRVVALGHNQRDAAHATLSALRARLLNDDLLEVEVRGIYGTDASVSSNVAHVLGRASLARKT